MKIIFSTSANKDLLYWKRKNNRTYKRVVQLLHAIKTDPRSGIGKPESLKYSLEGCWSRRIDRQHRLVYKVTADNIVVVSCRFHY